MKKLPLVVAVLTALGAASFVYASGPSANDSARKPDTRITQKVTYEAIGKSVKVILADLSKMSGVTLNAGASDSDWQVRDRKMNIFVRDIPLSNLINSIADVMKFTWSKSKEEPPVYRLYMDRTALLDAETQRLREEDRRNRQEVERRQDMLRGMGELDKLTPDQLAQLKATSPFKYLAATTGIGKSLGQFFNASPIAMEAFASGQEMSLSGAEMPAAAQQGLVDALRAYRNFSPALVAGMVSRDIPQDAISLDQSTIRINPDMDTVRSHPLISDTVIGSMSVTLREDGPNITIPFLNPDSPIANFLARAAIKSKDENRPLSDVIQEMQGEVTPALLSAIKRDDSGEKPAQHTEDRLLRRKIRVKETKPCPLPSVLSMLADASNNSVVSDSYGQSLGFITLKEGETELSPLLNSIADAFHCNWDNKHGIFEFRDRNWFTKRAAQIPDAWIEAWKQTLKETGTLDIGDLTQLAMLTMEQCNVNLQGDQDLARSGVPSCVFSYRDLLRACSALSESQRKAIYTEAGLDMSSLSDSQWQGFEKLINSKNSNLLKNEDAKLTLSATRKAHEKQFDYTFTLKSSDETPPITWRFFTPKYVEPPKEDKPQAKPDTGKP